jgi:hypothetical protein
MLSRRLMWATHLVALLAGFAIATLLADARQSRDGGSGLTSLGGKRAQRQRDDDAVAGPPFAAAPCAAPPPAALPVCPPCPLVAPLAAIRSFPASSREPVVPLPAHLHEIVRGLYRSASGAEVSPYSGFNISAWPYDAQGWNGDAPILAAMVHETRANTVIEVGGWKGSSTRSLARALLDVASTHGGPAPQLLCVDTWQGAPEFLSMRSDPDHDMFMAHGYPHVYFQWLSNMAHAGFTNVAFPLAAPSRVAVEFLVNANGAAGAAGAFTADVIYIDGSHEYTDVINDVRDWFPFLRNDASAMIGDDYPWPGVMAAVNELVETSCVKGTVPKISDGKWYLLKGECPELAAAHPVCGLGGCVPPPHQPARRSNLETTHVA